MCKMQCVLALVAMYVGFVHSWDIAVSLGDELVFYTNGSKTGTERFKSQNLTAIAYDEIHNMMLYVDKQIDNDAICGYNLHSKEKKCFIKRVGGYIHSIAYDLATEKLFFTDTNERSINWISLKPGSNNNVNGNLLIKLDVPPSDIGVDSWSGYIYWSYLEKGNETYMERLRFNGSAREVLRNKTYMERVRFNGSDREVLKTWLSIFSFAMDPQTRKMYYFDGCEDCYYEFLARDDFNGKNVYRHYSNRHLSAPKELTVSKDYIYFMNGIESNSTVWQIPKNFSKDEEPKAILKFYDKSPLGIAANYKIIDQFHGVQDCEVVWSLLGKIYERCDVCEKYCLQGDCSINDEGLPNCRCNAGYSGKRCEVYACHGYCLNNGNCSLNEKNQPVCQCKGEYVGDRCEVADCLNYCIKGECSFNEEGLPTCSCNAGYSGERCEVYACHGYCQNNGNCSLNENSEPVCQCKGEYVGDRCEVADCLNYCIKGECSFNEEGLPTCSCNAGYSGERCEVYACHGYCQNHGNCSLNENSEPVCQCKGEYVGDRCEVADCLKYCIKGKCSFNEEGLPTCSCNAGYSGERCEVYACHGYCQNNGNCSLNENSEPVCQCKGEYVGDRCEVADCLNYCIKGECSFNEEGLPTCSCNAGYSGERCEVYACHGYCQNNGNCSLNENSEPVCQCKREYVGDRCEVADCLNYCIKGECSFNEEGLPTCSCNAGYSGERCEVYACHGYCLNKGICTLNEEDEPFCQCVDNHDGVRCEAAINDTFTNTPLNLVKRNLTLADLLSSWRKPTSKIFVTVEV